VGFVKIDSRYSKWYKMLTINNFEKLDGYQDDKLRISGVFEYADVYRIFVDYAISFENINIYISINRNKRTDIDPKFPLDKTPVYNTTIEQRFLNGGTKRKDLGIKKKALESTDNMIKAIKEMLDDFVNER
jgi:hypothetical protein